MPHRPFNELIAKMPLEARGRAREMADDILAEMELSELREALKVRQGDIAKALKTTQAAISRLEARPDTKVSTLERYIRALGGHLEMRAVLPDRTIKLTHAVLARKKNATTVRIHTQKSSDGTKLVISRKQRRALKDDRLSQ